MDRVFDRWLNETAGPSGRRVADSFELPLDVRAEVDGDKVEATLENGVLSLRLPKAESAKPKAIAVQTNSVTLRVPDRQRPVAVCRAP